MHARRYTANWLLSQYIIQQTDFWVQLHYTFHGKLTLTATLYIIHCILYIVPRTYLYNYMIQQTDFWVQLHYTFHCELICTATLYITQQIDFRQSVPSGCGANIDCLDAGLVVNRCPRYQHCKYGYWPQVQDASRNTWWAHVAGCLRVFAVRVCVFEYARCDDEQRPWLDCVGRPSVVRVEVIRHGILWLMARNSCLFIFPFFLCCVNPIFLSCAWLSWVVLVKRALLFLASFAQDIWRLAISIACSHRLPLTHTHTHAPAYTHTHACARAHTNTHTHAHTHTHTHIHKPW